MSGFGKLDEREKFEEALMLAFSYPDNVREVSGIAREEVVPAIHFMSVPTLSDIAFSSEGYLWGNKWFDDQKQSGELGFVDGSGESGTIKWTRAQRGNDTLVMATDGKTVFISTDDTQDSRDWADNIFGGLSYRGGQIAKYISFGLFGEKAPQGVDALPNHAQYWTSLVRRGDDSLQSVALTQLEEWLEEHPGLEVKLVGYSRGGRVEMLADEIIQLTETHNIKSEDNAELSHVITLNSPEIGKDAWAEELNGIYHDAGVKVWHVEAVNDLVSTVKLFAGKTGETYILFDGMLMQDVEPITKSRLQIFNRFLFPDESDIISEHISADDKIINQVSNCSILTGDQVDRFSELIDEYYNEIYENQRHYINGAGGYSYPVLTKPENFDEEYSKIKMEALFGDGERICSLELPLDHSVAIRDNHQLQHLAVQNEEAARYPS